MRHAIAALHFFCWFWRSQMVQKKCCCCFPLPPQTAKAPRYTKSKATCCQIAEKKGHLSRKYDISSVDSRLTGIPEFLAIFWCIISPLCQFILFKKWIFIFLPFKCCCLLRRQERRGWRRRRRRRRRKGSFLSLWLELEEEEEEEEEESSTTVTTSCGGARGEPPKKVRGKNNVGSSSSREEEEEV